MARQHFWTISSVLSAVPASDGARKAGARSDIKRLLRRDAVRNELTTRFCAW